ncbi:uncharacterized protein LOC111405594 isoform X2 [Olea europaea var. sylvestris]|uniref:uncharacterized protein LOC111405594 isoform X2 n=1 Tax=Olea europaea var. sylvestris TaxID=158386 RepID=UPI000C1D2250|nr:uncharacterized protein LOC111405594 isoform X2 [Olea europaea var. sylvestris]
MLNGTKKRSQVSCREYYSYKLQIGLFGFFVELHTILVLLQRPSKSWLYQSYHNGLPLHHDTKRGLDQTVKLLLSHGHMCLFSGWLKELYGPSFLKLMHLNCFQENYLDDCDHFTMLPPVF